MLLSILYTTSIYSKKAQQNNKTYLFNQIKSVWKAKVSLFTQGMYVKRNSPLPSFLAHLIRKLRETGIINMLVQRHVIPEPNCKPRQTKGRSLGLEKFASLFVFYFICCIVSLIILLVENIYKPSHGYASQLLASKSSPLSLKLNALHRELETIEAKDALILLNEVMALMK